jgi:hypothetical protein
MNRGDGIWRMGKGNQRRGEEGLEDRSRCKSEMWIKDVKIEEIFIFFDVDTLLVLKTFSWIFRGDAVVYGTGTLYLHCTALHIVQMSTRKIDHSPVETGLKVNCVGTVPYGLQILINRMCFRDLNWSHVILLLFVTIRNPIILCPCQQRSRYRALCQCNSKIIISVYEIT